jgi:hypothetical protein
MKGRRLALKNKLIDVVHILLRDRGGRHGIVGIATRYVLDCPGFTTLWGQEIFSLPEPFQTGPGAHPDSFNGYRVKRQGRGWL